MKKTPFRLTPYQVQWLLVVGFLTVGYALYLRYLAIEFSTVALACDAGLQTMLCNTRILATYLFRNSVFGAVALLIAALHVIRPSIVLPKAIVSFEADSRNARDSITSRRKIVSRRGLGTSMPTCGLPGMRSMRIDSAFKARQRSSTRPVTREYFTPGSGLNS